VYTQRMRSDAVGAFLRDDRHFAFSEPINITTDGTGEDSRARGLKIRDYLAKVGYPKIAVVSFITESGSASENKPVVRQALTDMP
jgi:hypothetical protein